MEVKFAPFSSAVNPGFWNALTKLKLEVLGLEDDPLDVHGYYENRQQNPGSLMNVERDAFDLSKCDGHQWSTYGSIGQVIIHNTMESFKKLDKVQFLNLNEGQKLLKAMQSGEVLNDPRMLGRFVVHLYADLKKYHYYYWFAFPAIVLNNLVLVSDMSPMSENFKQNEINHLSNNYHTWKKSLPIMQSGFFWLTKDFQFLTLKQGFDENDCSELLLGFADPSHFQEYPGWPLRNLLALLAIQKPQMMTKAVKILCLRQKAEVGGELTICDSKIIEISCNSISDLKDLKVTGWEKNEKNQFAPRFANMKSSMDPRRLAESSVDLNLKLMKWRLVPNLDLDKFYNLKCLLLGSGTLGCNVARCLLGWGVKTVNFVDNSKVSFSNPVRQSLFNFEDCLDGGKNKAEAAAEMLAKVFPGVQSKGYTLTIPMPGHPISESTKARAKHDYDLLEDLINDHDVIFLLMDTRESRWLPTVMAAAKEDKLVINAALGFDTFLVMRHGIRTQESWDSFQHTSGIIPGNQLGCYFCNDVVAPGDSTKDRTLDQQCTVTRPGVSYQAAAFAVEVMASTLQHPMGVLAPAVTKEDHDQDTTSPLGPTIHSIRGSISSFSISKPTTQRFSNCTACSQKVLKEFKESGFDLLLQTAKDNKYLEKLTGLDDLMSMSNFDDVIACSDEDDF